MNEATASLDSLGRKFGTDKSSWHHDYLRFYEQFFSRFRHMKTRILEIGVAGGASLRVWESFFEQGTVIGADINPTAMCFARPRVLIEIVDQSIPEELLKLGRTHGPFDIVIEDGSHMWAHQINTLKTLFPFVKEGGIYIVEDLHTNYGRLQSGFRGDSAMSCVDYLKKLVDIRVADKMIDASQEGDEFIRDYGRRMDSITFYKESCLIQRRKISVLDEPLLALDNDEASKHLSIGAHIGCYGGRTSPSAVVRGGDDGQNIQGFKILCDSPLGQGVSYRARLADGSWTEWAKCGAFVGTIGKSEDLTGFSVRLAGQCNDEYDVVLIGAFRDSSSNVIVGNEDACVPKTSGAAMWGMQVAMTRRARGSVTRD